MTVLAVGAINVTILLLLVFAAMPLLRRQSAALRHCVLATALVSAALLPLVGPMLPDLEVPVPTVATRAAAIDGERAPAEKADAVAAASATHATDSPWSADLIAGLVRLWVLGAIVAAVALVVAFARLAYLARTATPVADRRWRDRADAIRRALGIRRPVTLLESRDPHLLVVWGALGPHVLLPAPARDWPDERIDIVLTHELAHVARGDWMVQCLAEALRAIYWFNPLVWTACARLRQESDHACDDIVLTGGVDGSDYAQHLVDIARVLRRRRAWAPAPAMAHTSGFERRVQAMLNSQLDRRPLSRRAHAVTTTAFLLLALPIAALTAAQQALVTFTGSVLDPSNAVLPNAVVTLTNTDTQAKYEVRTNREGRYEIPGLPSGRYLLESRVPGFQAVKMELTVGGQNVERDLKLEIGTLQETITIAHGGPLDAPRQMTAEQKARFEERMRKRAAEVCSEGAAGRDATRIGGNLRVPVKLRDVRPVYPADLASTGVSGTVVLLALIGTGGSVQDVTVESASHREFADAAMDAVRQWEFDATLLNCVPVETRMIVTANFVQR
jgi:TonB family protein